MTRKPKRSSEVLAIVLAALAGAFIGRWIFGLRSTSVAILVAAVASMVSIALVELLDRGSPAPSTSTASAPSVPLNWWDQPPSAAQLAPQPVSRQRGDDSATVNLASPQRGSERWYQCPTCGGFDIYRSQGPAHRCNECGSSWNWQAPSPWPRVTIDVKARSGVRR